MIPRARRVLILGLLVSLVACSARELQPVDLGPPPPPDLRGPARHVEPFAYQRCAPLEAPRKKLRPVELAGVWLRPEGYTLAAAPEASGWVRKRLVLGVLADPREALLGTLQNIDALTDRFNRHKVHAIIVLGGIASTANDQQRILSRLLRATEVPVLVLPGDLAARDELRKTLDALGHRIVDLSEARILRHPAATLISLPGHHLARQLRAGKEGCAYQGPDLRDLEMKGKDGAPPRLLLAYGPPRGKGPDAIDRSLTGVNCGSVALRELMDRAQISFGLFAHVNEAGGAATTRAGSRLGEQTWSTSMLLNVGSVQAVPQRGLDGQWRHGMGVVVELRDGRARFRSIDLEAAPASALQSNSGAL